MAYSPCDPRMSHQHIPVQTFLAVLLILARATPSSDTVSYNRPVYPFRASIIVDKTHIVTVSAIEIRKPQATEQKRWRPQTWTTRLTRAIGTLASIATQWSATNFARPAIVNRLSCRRAPILRLRCRTPERTNRIAKAATPPNARTRVLDAFK